MRNAKGCSTPKSIRCAIYTRKSTEEGLEQDFNSLDAQREACAAYILSQRHEGWTLVPDYYDDGGYSGGNMDRPALKAVLAEVAAKRVDVIVVYKVDRLTRSLSDFARIVDVLDDADASFVSVTQSFNTTTSMGRLTLNVLLSFAQFEREVTGERIRDKIAASKAKGMWMGGQVPLGYDLDDRKLIINPEEAATVRHIFERYATLGSGKALLVELDADGIKSKARINRHGRAYGQNSISRGALYAMLQNRLYVGEVVHKGQCYPGQHEGIIDPGLFDQVQQQLKNARVDRRLGSNAVEPSLLAGLMIDGHGRRLSPSHAVKQGRRYRYYVSQNDGAEASGEPCWRISANDIETLVCAKVRQAIHDTIHQRMAVGDLSGDVITRMGRNAVHIRQSLEDQVPAKVREVLLFLVQRIQINQASLDIQLDVSTIDSALGETGPITITSKIGFVRSDKQVRIHIPPVIDEANRPRNPVLIKLIAQAFTARQEMEAGGSFDEVATRIGCSREHLADLIRTSYLAPSIIKAIIDGEHPPTLTRKQLVETSRIPLDWEGQQKMFGFV